MKGRGIVPRAGLVRPASADLELIEVKVKGCAGGELESVALGGGVDLVGMFEVFETLPCFAALEEAAHGGSELDECAFGVKLDECKVIHRKERCFEGEVILCGASDGEGLSVFKGSLIEDGVAQSELKVEQGALFSGYTEKLVKPCVHGEKVSIEPIGFLWGGRHEGALFSLESVG